jgi:hypothetical protein
MEGDETTSHQILPEGSRIEGRTEKSINCGVNEEDDPALLFEQISGIENKFNTVNYQIPKTDRLATVLEKAPKEYGTVLTVCFHVPCSNLSTSHDSTSKYVEKL